MKLCLCSFGAVLAVMLVEQSQAQVAPGPLDRAGMVGRWGQNGTCDRVLEIRNDGTYALPHGAPDLWHLEGGNLILAGNGMGRFQLHRTGADSIELRQPRRIVPLTRCPGGERGRSLPLDGTRLSESLLEGRWAEYAPGRTSDSCARAFTLHAGGRATSPPLNTYGGAMMGDAPTYETGRWSLRGDRLTVAFDGTPMDVRLVPVDRNHIFFLTEDGLGRFQRC